jgi:hypothetical protein
MKPTSYVEYEGKKYPVFTIKVTDPDDSAKIAYEVGISTESLEDAIINPENSLPWGLDALSIDEDIFYYIPDSMAEASEEEITRYVNQYAW